MAFLSVSVQQLKGMVEVQRVGNEVHNIDDLTPCILSGTS